MIFPSLYNYKFPGGTKNAHYDYKKGCMEYCLAASLELPQYWRAIGQFLPALYKRECERARKGKLVRDPLCSCVAGEYFFLLLGVYWTLNSKNRVHNENAMLAFLSRDFIRDKDNTAHCLLVPRAPLVLSVRRRLDWTEGSGDGNGRREVPVVMNEAYIRANLNQ